MKNKTFAPGTRVSELVKNRSSRPRKGTVLSSSVDEPSHQMTDPVFVLVVWDKKYYESSATTAKVNPSNLMLEVDADAKLSQLEIDFEQLEKSLEAKLKDAANIIADAAKIAKAHGEVLGEMEVATDLLAATMSRAGWNTSSWNC